MRVTVKPLLFVRLAWLLGRLGWLRLLFPRRLLRFPQVIVFCRYLRLLVVEGPIVMLVPLVLLLSAVVGISTGLVGDIMIVLDLLCRVCVTCLRECGLGCGYGLAYSSV